MKKTKSNKVEFDFFYKKTPLFLSYPEKYEKYKCFKNIPNFILEESKKLLTKLKKTNLKIKNVHQEQFDELKYIFKNRIPELKNFQLEIYNKNKIFRFVSINQKINAFIENGKIYNNQQTFNFISKQELPNKQLLIKFDFSKSISSMISLMFFSSNFADKIFITLEKGLIFIYPYEQRILVLPDKLQIKYKKITFINKITFIMELAYAINMNYYGKISLTLQNIFLYSNKGDSSLEEYKLENYHNFFHDLLDINEKELLKLICFAS